MLLTTILPALPPHLSTPQCPCQEAYSTQETKALTLVLELMGLAARGLSKPRKGLWTHPWTMDSLSILLFLPGHSARADGVGVGEAMEQGGVGAGGCKGRGAGRHQTKDWRGLGVRPRFLCWIILQQFYCNYPENAAIYRVSQTAAVPGGRGRREREWEGRRREEVGGGDRKGKGIRQEEG